MIKSAKEQINGLEKGEIQQLSQESQISLTKKMANFGYSGRKTATSDPVHTGRAVMRALF